MLLEPNTAVEASTGGSRRWFFFANSRTRGGSIRFCRISRWSAVGIGGHKDTVDLWLLCQSVIVILGHGRLFYQICRLFPNNQLAVPVDFHERVLFGKHVRAFAQTDTRWKIRGRTIPLH
jgi:hypothetical protein